MNLSRHFNILMASAVSISISVTPMMGTGVAHAQNAPAAEAPGDAAWQKEFEAWRTASKSGKAADYEAYLRTYPTGKFASVAKKRIEELNGPVVADQSQVDAQKTADVAQSQETVTRSADIGDPEAEKKRDLEMWRQVSKTGTKEDYEKYLKAFPKGKFAKVAKTRIEALVAKASGPAADDAIETAEAKADNKGLAVADREDVAQPEVPSVQDDSTEVAQTQPVVEDEAPAQADQARADDPGDWEKEYALWKEASQGNTIAEYDAYLAAYPKGKFAAIAQSRIVQLAAAEKPVADVAEGDTMDNEDKQAARTDTRKNQPAEDQADDQQFAAAEQPDADDMAQDTRARQDVRYTEGTPETEDEFLPDPGFRREIQGRLSALGYDTGGADGVYGPRSRDAIAAWQQDNGAPVTGYLSGDQIAEIRKTSQAVYQEWLNSQVVVQEKVVVRPRREKVVVVEERDPALDAAVAVGVLGAAVIGAHKFKHRHHRAGRHHNKVKIIGDFHFGKKAKFGCKKKKRRC